MLNPGYLRPVGYVVGVTNDKGRHQYYAEPDSWTTWENASRLSWAEAETVRKRFGGAWIENALRAE